VRRRQFITLLGGAAAAWPLAARAQQGERVRRIGVLMGHLESDSKAQAHIAAFRDGLHKLGWTEGNNTRIDTRWTAPGDTQSMQPFAKELVALQPDIILSNTTPTTRHCCSKHAPFPSFSRSLAIRLAVALSQASRDLAETSPVSTFRNRRSPASGWNCSRRSYRVLPESRYCSTQHRRRMPNIG
jgi:hypothetical protein